jgi:hypothetical protein
MRTLRKEKNIPYQRKPTQIVTLLALIYESENRTDHSGKHHISVSSQSLINRNKAEKKTVLKKINHCAEGTKY